MAAGHGVGGSLAYRWAEEGAPSVSDSSEVNAKVCSVCVCLCEQVYFFLNRRHSFHQIFKAPRTQKQELIDVAVKLWGRVQGPRERVKRDTPGTGGGRGDGEGN